MALMLAVIFLCVAVGVLAPQFGPRIYIVVALLATTMTALYYAMERTL